MKDVAVLKVDKDVDGTDIYGTDTFKFVPGVTVLLGCNGSGKTTLMRRALDDRSRKGSPCYWYDIRKADSTLGARAFVSGKDAAEYLTSKFLSEGEKMKHQLSKLVGELGGFVFSDDVKDAGEAWIFFDSLDSGWSIDNCREFVELTHTIFESNPEGVRIYLLIAANAYEFARQEGWAKLDVQTGGYLPCFESYDGYAKYVMGTRERKDRIWDNEKRLRDDR